MTTTAEHIAAIRKALEAGPTPGEWRHGNANGYIANTVFDRKDDGICEVFGIPLHQELETVLADERHREGVANAMLISSCNPVAMTAVIAEIDRLEAENERMRTALEFYDCHGPVLCDCTEGQEDKDNVCCGFRARAALKGDTHGN